MMKPTYGSKSKWAILDSIAKEIRKACGEVPLDFYEQYDALGIEGIPSIEMRVAFRDRVIKTTLRKIEQSIRNRVPASKFYDGNLEEETYERLGWGQ